MKRLLIGGIAVTVCLGLATTAVGQFAGDNRPAPRYQYSSYGYQDQDTAPSSPSDVAIPPSQDAVPTPSDQAIPSPTPSSDGSSTASCTGDCGGQCDGGCGAGIGGHFGGLGSACGIGTRLGLGCADRNWVVGVRGLIFSRDSEDDVNLGQNGAGQYLFSTTADIDTMGGVETYLGVRSCTGWGWQIGYWGLYPSQADVTFSGPGLYTTLRGLGDIYFNPTGQDLAAIYDNADDWRIYRNNEIHNLEFNLLRNGGCVQGLCCRSINLEWSAGVRWLRFDESFRYGAFSSNPAYPAQMFYDLETQNDLIGFQLGCRTERCLWKRFSLAIGTKLGVYNNDIYARQSIHDGAGNFAIVNAGPYAPQDYNLASRKDDVSFLGEFDLGLNYQINNCWRANFGYRALGITGVALAPNQIPANFRDIQNINRIKSNCSLILHGAYIGAERCF